MGKYGEGKEGEIKLECVGRGEVTFRGYTQRQCHNRIGKDKHRQEAGQDWNG